MPSPLLSDLLTFGTALAVALALIPLFRLALIPLTRGGPAATSRVTRARIGSLSVFIAVAILLPMGGDGLAVRWSDARLALGMLLAAGLMVVGMTKDYRALEHRPRLALQAAFGFTATLVGLRPAGIAPDIVACGIGAAMLVGCSNALRFVDAQAGLAAAGAAITAAFLALAAHLLGVHEWCDLNLGLSGALLALLAFNQFGGRFKVDLGESGCLCVGFLFGLTLIRLSSAALPGTRPALALFVALPIIEALFTAGRHHFARPRNIEHLYDLLFALGLSKLQALILFSAVTAVTSIAALRLLHLVG